jgi:hypothetical protein
MAARGRPKAELVLSDEERDTLVRWSRRRKSAQALVLRCRIVLSCAEGLTNGQVAEKLGISLPTVGKWRSRFVERRLEGLVDEQRPGAPRRISDEQVESVVVATLEQTPKDATHWSRASMAKRSGLSKSTVGRIWKAFRLKPHLNHPGFRAHLPSWEGWHDVDQVRPGVEGEGGSPVSRSCVGLSVAVGGDEGDLGPVGDDRRA